MRPSSRLPLRRICRLAILSGKMLPPKTVAKSSRPKRRSRPSYRAPIQQARFESLTQDVLISNGRVKQSAPAYYGSVDVSQAHNIMQNSILRGAANQELPITPENSGEKALKKALADGWQTQSVETISDSTGRTAKNVLSDGADLRERGCRTPRHLDATAAHCWKFAGSGTIGEVSKLWAAP